MAMAKKLIWDIGMSGSDYDNVTVYRVVGTAEQVKQHLVSLVNKDKSDKYYSFEYGTDSVDDVLSLSPEKFYAYSVGSSQHSDYTATLVDPKKAPAVLGENGIIKKAN